MWLSVLILSFEANRSDLINNPYCGNLNFAQCDPTQLLNFCTAKNVSDMFVKPAQSSAVVLVIF